MNTVRGINTLWTWQCRRAATAFVRGTREVAKTQSHVLREILRSAELSDYGRRFDFQRIREPRDFQRLVPAASYDDLRPWIEEAVQGKQHVLSGERIRLFQPTSGSSGGEKLVPYTDLLRRQFQRAIQAWIWNLYTAVPGVRRGRAYWSISPGAQLSRSTPAGIPIGFDHDVEYLSPVMRWLVARLLVVPSDVARLRHPDNFRYATLCYLLASDDLALISVWSPTFLMALLSQLEPWLDSICRDISRGTLTLPADAEDLAVRMRSNPLRARQLREIFQVDVEPSARLRAAWPQLALISCWSDAASALYRAQLEALFPNILLQPKGLVATEGIISIPLVGRQGAALAVTSHFFEFLACDDLGDSPRDERPRLAHELARHARYQVLLTTGGGFYRYCLGDVVEVVDFLDQCPLLRFVGRAAGVSDLVGEKLAESHVGSVLAGSFAQLRLAPRFAMLAPTRDNWPGYRLYLECDGVDPGIQNEVAQCVERGLCQNPHYRYAVAIRQLRPLEVTVLRGPQGIGWRVFQQELETRGQKAGDIKPVACDGRSDWSSKFAAGNEPSVQRCQNWRH